MGIFQLLMRTFINHNLGFNKLHSKLQFKIYSGFATSGSKPLSYYYNVLGLKPGCTADQLKSAYLDMVKKYHPDLSKDPNSVSKFQQVQAAYDILQETIKNKNVPPPRPTSSTTQQKNDGPTKIFGDREAAEQFDEQFLKKYSRKNYKDDSMHFSYNLYKKHYEQVQQKKKDYIKYPGHQREQYAHKDEKQGPIWSSLGAGALILGLAGGAIYFVNLK